MTSLYALVSTVMDSFAVQIIFGVWTGIWLVQLMRGSAQTATWVFAAMALAFAGALFVISANSSSA